MAFDFESELSDDSYSASRPEPPPLTAKAGATIQVHIPWIPPAERQLFEAVEVGDYESETEYERGRGRIYGRSRGLRRAVQVRCCCRAPPFLFECGRPRLVEWNQVRLA